MPSAGSDTINSTGDYIYVDTHGCSIFRVVCDADSAQNALVNIDSLHDPDEFFPLAPGELADFKLNHLGIRRVFVKGDGGDCDIRYGVIAKSDT